jgi:hypothetical protein
MRLLFVVQQVSPVCRIVDRFTIDAQPGRNRVRFPGKASRLQLAAGTYRISARTPSGRLVRRVTLVVVGSGIPSRNEIAAARAANVCASARRLVSAAGGSTGASNTGALSDGPVFQRSASGGSPDRGANSHSGAVLGASVEEAARALQPILIALLALAIMLLAVASLPRTAVLEPRANDLLARHRSEIAGLGAAAFIAVVITFLLG